MRYFDSSTVHPTLFDHVKCTAPHGGCSRPAGEMSGEGLCHFQQIRWIFGTKMVCSGALCLRLQPALLAPCVRSCCLLEYFYTLVQHMVCLSAGLSSSAMCWCKWIVSNRLNGSRCLLACRHSPERLLHCRSLVVVHYNKLQRWAKKLHPVFTATTLSTLDQYSWFFGTHMLGYRKLTSGRSDLIRLCNYTTL